MSKLTWFGKFCCLTVLDTMLFAWIVAAPLKRRSKGVGRPYIKRHSFPKVRCGTLVYVRYRDHVLYHRSDPVSLKPQTRECVGWLVYEAPDYIIMCWDRDAGPPTLKGGDLKASGLVLLRSDILELECLG